MASGIAQRHVLLIASTWSSRPHAPDVALRVGDGTHSYRIDRGEQRVIVGLACRSQQSLPETVGEGRHRALQKQHSASPQQGLDLFDPVLSGEGFPDVGDDLFSNRVGERAELVACAPMRSRTTESLTPALTPSAASASNAGLRITKWLGPSGKMSPTVRARLSEVAVRPGSRVKLGAREPQRGLVNGRWSDLDAEKRREVGAGVPGFE